MDKFDNRLKRMAEQEECIVPNEFDQRITEVLDGLPPHRKKRGPGAVKGVLVAAAACVHGFRRVLRTAGGAGRGFGWLRALCPGTGGQDVYH